jgi:hypothetical protein
MNKIPIGPIRTNHSSCHCSVTVQMDDTQGKFNALGIHPEEDAVPQQQEEPRRSGRSRGASVVSL